MTENNADTQQPMKQFSAADVYQRLTPKKAREALERALQGSFDPKDDATRLGIDAAGGQLLAMPSAVGEWAGCKLASVAPGNPDKGLPMIQGTYVLFDAATLTPSATVEGASLTAIRTPAVSALAADYLAPQKVKQLVVFGTGTQALHHVHAMLEIRDIPVIKMVGRSADLVEDAVATLREQGVEAQAGTAADVRDADLICCCTSAKEPLFAAEDLKPGACVAAMGTHTPEAREIPGAAFSRQGFASDPVVVVESVHTALEEAGDVLLAISEGHMDKDRLGTLKQLVNGEVTRSDSAPNIFKSTGMSWEDVVAAAAVVED